MKKKLLFCLFFALIILPAFAQNISVNYKAKGIESILSDLESKTNYTFVYQKQELSGAPNVTLIMQNAPLADILNSVCSAAGLEYEIVKQSIVLRKGQLKTNSSITVKGTVNDSNGQPVVGASVFVMGTTNGVVTDLDGKYSLQAKDGDVLVYSCLGYIDINRYAKAGVLNITLKDDTTALQEIVVIGYGTQKKANLTGAVSSINPSEAFGSRPIPDMAHGLQGMAPGLNVTFGSTEVGDEAILRIRGQVGSYEGGSEPLILLDNVEIPSLTLVNPDDIESISVLKDAASASIYGSKAAFGVVLIQTKQGAKNKERVSVTYSNNFGFQSMAQDYEIGGIESLYYSLRAAERTGNNYAGSSWYVSRSSLEAVKEWQVKYKDLPKDAPLTYGRDWYTNNAGIVGIRLYDQIDAMIRDYAPSQNHSVNLSGSNDKTSYNISLGYLDQTGMMKTTNYDFFNRYNANIRVKTKVNNWLSVNTGLMLTNSTKSWAYRNKKGGTDAWFEIFRWSALMPTVMYDEYSNYVRNAVYETTIASQATAKTTYNNANIGATITPLKNWNIDLNYTYSKNIKQNHYPGTIFEAGETQAVSSTIVGMFDENQDPVMVNNEWNQYNELGETIQAYSLGKAIYNSDIDHIYQDVTTSITQTWNITSTYDLKLGESTYKFMLGMNSVESESNGVWGQKTELMDYNNPQFSLATGAQTSGGSFGWSSRLGFFGRINYNYKERYLMEANLRYDGSSKFPSHLRWMWFPSFSAGWRISEEPWMKPYKDVISLAKVRASWGSIGDQTIASSLYIPTISSMSTSWVHDMVLDTPYKTPALIDSDITWQMIQTLDFGVDVTLFKSLGVTFDWYRRATKNMIVGLGSIGYNVGAAAPKGNYGDLHTDGWELEVNWGHSFSNGLNLSLFGTLADAKTIIDRYGDTATNIKKWYDGKTYGEIWGYKVDRLFQNDDFAWENGKLVAAEDKYGKIYKFAEGKNYATQGKFTEGNYVVGPGDIKYVDVNGDGVIDNGSELLDDHGDLVVIGNTTPRFEYSFRVSADWKGFDASVFFQGIGKRQLWGNSSTTMPGYHTGGCIPRWFATDYWYEDKDENGNVIAANYDGFFPRATNFGLTSCKEGAFDWLPSDKYLLDMSYLRIKNITVGYSIPSKALKKVNIRKVRVFASLENFFTFDHLHGLPIDVEDVPGYSYYGSDYLGGRAGTSAPASKTTSFGVQVTF